MISSAPLPLTSSDTSSVCISAAQGWVWILPLPTSSATSFVSRVCVMRTHHAHTAKLCMCMGVSLDMTLCWVDKCMRLRETVTESSGDRSTRCRFLWPIQPPMSKGQFWWGSQKTAK